MAYTTVSQSLSEYKIFVYSFLLVSLIKCKPGCISRVADMTDAQ